MMLKGDEWQFHLCYYKISLDLIVSFLWINHACFLRGANSVLLRFSVLLGLLLWDFCDSKSNKIGISLHLEVLPFLNLLSAALNPCGSLQCCQGNPAALPSAAVVTEERRWTSCVQMLSMRPRREEHPVRWPQPYGLKRRTPLELLAFSSGTEAHCSGPALHAT